MHRPVVHPCAVKALRVQRPARAARATARFVPRIRNAARVLATRPAFVPTPPARRSARRVPEGNVAEPPFATRVRAVRGFSSQCSNSPAKVVTSGTALQWRSFRSRLRYSPRAEDPLMVRVGLPRAVVAARGSTRGPADRAVSPLPRGLAAREGLRRRAAAGVWAPWSGHGWRRRSWSGTTRRRSMPDF
jgi:hypothetical protein